MRVVASSKEWKPIQSLSELSPEDRERWQRFCDLVDEWTPYVLEQQAERRAAQQAEAVAEAATCAEMKKEAA